MLRQTLATALLLGLALSPAIAKDKGKQDNNGRPVENVTDQIERLQDRLQQDLAAERRDKIEGQIEKLVDKYGITLPPPPDPTPEPTVLFKDDFNRPDGAIVGNGWQQSAFPAVGLSNGAMSLNDTGTVHGVAINYVDLAGTNYQSITLAYDLVANAGSQPNSHLDVSWSPDGVQYSTLITHDLSNPNIQDPNNPQHFSWTVESVDLGQSFAWKFEDSGSGGALIDNVTVNGEPFPASSFVGF